MAALTICDQTTSGSLTGQSVLEFLADRITVRELIRSRVYQEVQDYNHAKSDGALFNGLVQPTGAEQALNGVRLKKHREIDWKQQFEKACDAFTRNGIFILLEDRQLETLDEEIELKPGMQVNFVRLVPLVGG
jgi:hypothetical protein